MPTSIPSDLHRRPTSQALWRKLVVVTSAGLAHLVAPPASAVEKSLGDLTGPWQLFVDNHGIDEMRGVVRTFHPFVKDPRNPFGVSGMAGRGTILPSDDGRGYRKWIGASRMAVSSDGYEWKIVPLVRNYDGERGNATVMHTPWDKGREYKMIGWKRIRANNENRDVYGRFGSFSSDGIKWFDVGPEPLLWNDQSDTGLFGWDPHARRYFGAPKIFSYVRGFSRRSVGFSASRDFAPGWPSATIIVLPDAMDDQWVARPGQRTEFYNFSPFAYESMYLGILEVFRNTDGWKDGTIHAELVSSRDGLVWERVPGERTPMLARGNDGAWDDALLGMPLQPLVEGNVIKLLYHANSFTHGHGRNEYPTAGQTRDPGAKRLGWATLRKDGFVSLDAAAASGVVTTQLLHGVRGRLAVNCDVRGGSVKAEILDATGAVIPGYGLEDAKPISVDDTRALCAWRQHEELPGGRPVRIRFHLQDASLYSYSAGDSVRIEYVRPERAVLYTFEGDAGNSATDRLTADGAQSLHFLNAVIIDDDSNAISKGTRAAFGKSEAIFLKDSQHAQMMRVVNAYEGRTGYPWSAVTWNVLEIDQSFQLGKRFTLAAMINVEARHKARLFSSWDPFQRRLTQPPYERKGWIGLNELVVDFDAAGGSFGCFRAVIHGAEVTAPGKFDGGKYHHLAVTYEDGLVTLYLDGREVGRGNVPGGVVDLISNLHVGGNPGAFVASSADPVTSGQFEGAVDDILVISRSLSAAQVQMAAARGGQYLFDAGLKPALSSGPRVSQ